MDKLLKAQQEIGAIKKESDNPFFKSKYFDINAILAEVKPILNKNDLVVLQPLVVVDGKNALKTTIVDVRRKDLEDEEWTYESNVLVESITLLPEGLDPQKTGSAITYFRRYALQSLLALEAEDDDGNVASGKVSKKDNEDLPF